MTQRARGFEGSAAPRRRRLPWDFAFSAAFEQSSAISRSAFYLLTSCAALPSPHPRVCVGGGGLGRRRDGFAALDARRAVRRCRPCRPIKNYIDGVSGDMIWFVRLQSSTKIS